MKIDPIEDIINEMASDKIMSEILNAYEGLSHDERTELLNKFGAIINEHGETSAELMDYFHELSMKHSKTYYFLKTHLNQDDDKWDKALDELSQK